MTLPVLDRGRSGRVRPGPPWRRHSAAQLRLSRLAAACETEADRYTDGSPVAAVVASCASALRAAVGAINEEAVAEGQSPATAELEGHCNDQPAD